MTPAFQVVFAAVAPGPVNPLVTKTLETIMSTPRPLYAAAITDAIVGGDLDQLRKLQALAEEHVAEYGDVGTLLAALKVEIAKLGARS